MRHPRQTIVSSPVGPLRLVVDDAGALTHLLFASREEAARAPGEPSGRSCLDEVERQLRAYFAGEREDFDVPLRPGGTPFQLAVWEALRAIPYAETRSYAQQAAAIGRPRAVRAVGAANGRNPISIIVPCHRVVGADGGLTGYGGGIAHKRWLLDHERRTRTGQLELASSGPPASDGQGLSAVQRPHLGERQVAVVVADVGELGIAGEVGTVSRHLAAETRDHG